MDYDDRNPLIIVIVLLILLGFSCPSSARQKQVKIEMRLPCRRALAHLSVSG